MRQPKFSSDRGSAILEFLAFVLVGQLLIFSGSMTISQQLTAKVSLQNLAVIQARSISKNLDLDLPSGVLLTERSCGARFVCIVLSQNGQTVSAVSLR
jgi:hypothetical protein